MTNDVEVAFRPPPLAVMVYVPDGVHGQTAESRQAGRRRGRGREVVERRGRRKRQAADADAGDGVAEAVERLDGNISAAPAATFFGWVTKVSFDARAGVIVNEPETMLVSPGAEAVSV